MSTSERFCVVQLDAAGKVIATVAGMGRNKGTWDTTCNSRRTASRWAKECRAKHPGKRYAVDTSP